MKLDQKVIDRLTELIQMGESVGDSKYNRSTEYYIHLGDLGVDFDLSHQWGTSSLSLLGRVFGRDAEYYKKFDEIYPHLTDLSPVMQGLGILRAAKDDYEHGYLFEARMLIQAEVFDDFLSQAEHLSQTGYYQPAAVIGGSVLEDGLRRLCERKDIALPDRPKLDQMNADLAKSGAYNVLMQKRVTFLADIRNKAAHGKWDEFTANDVETMIAEVRHFMETFFL